LSFSGRPCESHRPCNIASRLRSALMSIFRENGKVLIQHYKDNAEALAKFVVKNREAILNFSLFYCRESWENIRTSK
jgi:hypothetical protein